MALASTSATASAAVLKNPFLGARRALANAASLGAAKPVTRRVVVVAAAVGKKSWIPAVKSDAEFINPSWLDGSLPGDFGFDPLGLGKDPAFLKWYREAELIHGRWAMAAVLGIFSFGSLLGTQLLLMGWVESKRWVDFFNPDSQSVEWATPWSRTAENFANFTGEQGYPGGKFFDPLGLGGETKDGVYIPDTEKLERLKVAEIKHSRLAMLAMLIFYFEAGQGKTPLGALGL
ncbi:unnamed protein product [Triticum turgidum subsp. durum]|uniref:Chlorophyll a-b binding protein, chloroplastic n=1 Tax=Triticum turgidum subsp. durum TaxID=4567 RepID=A0A9R1PRW3_TRITD|nr:unnamed protein product [Triticum turgidum subsp. durum]VAH48417.1 unnamed protein product [Triticum turgidum subsp. durum]